LRLEATHYIRQQLSVPPLPGWMLGPCHHRGIGTLQSLLEERVIDAWITSDLHDLPEEPQFTVIKLWEWPAELVVHTAHPLAHVRRPSRGDLERFPSLVLPEQLYPRIAQMVHDKGFGRNCHLERYDVGSWDGLTHDAVTIVYGSCLSLANDRSLKRLHWDLGITSGEALVLLREWQDAPAIALLLEDLRQRQFQLQQQLPELVGYL
jgi:DNA-binding transcriptional LysR family regulator